MAYETVKANTNEVLFVTAFSHQMFSLSWGTHADRMYDLQETRTLNLPTWTSKNTFVGTGGMQTTVFPAQGISSFFRVEEYINPFQKLPFYVDPDSRAARYVASTQISQPTNAVLLRKISLEPQAKWLKGESDDAATAHEYAAAAFTSNSIPFFVFYNIPFRDCAGFSAGGAPDAKFYTNWVGEIVRGIGGVCTGIILEPDALAGLDCLAVTNQEERYLILSNAITLLVAITNIAIYPDAGNSRWQPVSVIASRLKRIGAGRAKGFALNVSNFYSTAETIQYGQALSKTLGGMHFVIDTSRNGLGPAPNNAWCNPPGRALGVRPTVDTGVRAVDAFLWVKRPGESDGTCNGGPAAGVFWPDYALGLISRTP